MKRLKAFLSGKASKQKDSANVIVSWFGKSGLVRGWCDSCDTTAFIVDGCFQCCDRPVKQKLSVKAIERQAQSQRGKISTSLKRKILFTQKHRCYYCGLDLSKTWYYLDKYGDLKQILINYDHFIPVSFAANETFDNLYATCNICNRLKANKMFNDVLEVREYLKNKLKELDIKIWSIKEAEDYLNK